MKAFYGIIFFLLLIASSVRSQCSDAGICSVENHVQPLRPLFFGLNYDLGYSGKYENMFIHDLKIVVNLQLLKIFSVTVTTPFTKKTFNNINFSGSEAGIGDIIINATTMLYRKSAEVAGCTLYDPSWRPYNEQSMWRFNDASLKLDAGVKLATGSVNKDHLPLRYQTGLGTNDLLLGISYVPAPDSSSWLYKQEYVRFWLGTQIPFGIASNSFDSIRRGPDIAAKITYFNAITNLDYQIELFAIKRLAKSTRYFQGDFILVNEGSPDVIDTLQGSYKLPNSDFFQVDLRVSAKYYFARNTGILFGGAIPFLKRKDNSDGTERKYTLFCGISYLWGGY